MLRLLHTNDLHGALTPFKAARLAELRAEADLLLDAGDAAGRPRGAGLGDDPTYRLLASAGLDAMTPGNHEFLLLASGALPDRLVAANLGERGGPAFPASRVFDTPDGPVAVIGVTTPWTKFSERPLRRMAPYEDAFAARFALSPPFEAVAAEVGRVRPSVRTLVVLSHLGEGGDRRLAARVPGIDVLLGAHTHAEVPPIRLGPTWYAQAGENARVAGRYDWDGTTLAGTLVSLGP